MNNQQSYRQKIIALAGAWAHNVLHPDLRLFVLENEFLLVTVTNYGLRIAHLLVPDSQGEVVDVIVGPETPEDFFASNNPYYGALIGRFANRIDKGNFVLNGVQHQLACNNGANHLHGGPGGLHTQLWNCISQSTEKLVFSHTSPHMAENYPGTLQLQVTIELERQSLKIAYHATTDAATIVNITHHPFFNLNGCGSSSLESHTLQLEADSYLPVRKDMIPEGTMAAVAGTPFDFRKPASVTQRLHLEHEQLSRGNGFDHSFVRNSYPEVATGLSATACSERTGIGMRIFSTEPGVHLYTGNFMDGTNKMKKGASDVCRSAFCLETQHFPDSPNQPQFPSVVLYPGQKYYSSTIFEFFNQPITSSL